MTKKASPPAAQTPRPQSIPSGPLKVEVDLTATERAWKAHEARARGLTPTSVNQGRIDVTQAAAIAGAGASNVLTQRERLSALFVAPPFGVFERVAEVARAAQHADLQHRASQDENAPYADILPRMNELRGLFLSDMDLVHKRQPEVLPQDKIDGIRAGDNSVRDKANDLNEAANWYRLNWTLIQRTTISAEEITEAVELAAKALARLGALLVTRLPKEGELSTGELRRRYFTLLANDYDVVRHYGSFLFWALPGGWEQYVPSLWSGRTGDTTTVVDDKGGTDNRGNAPPAPAKPA